MGGQISDKQNNTNSSKLVLVIDITVPHKLGTVISVTSICLDSGAVMYVRNFTSFHFPEKTKGRAQKNVSVIFNHT